MATDQFAGDITATLEIALIGGILGLICTGYWWFKYHEAGVFNSPVNKTIHLMQHSADNLPGGDS